MAATVTLNQQGVLGNVRYATADVTFDNSYPTGGYAITPANLGFSAQFYFVKANNAAGYLTRWDNTNGKLMLYWTGASTSAALAQVANTTDVSAASTRIFAIGE